jgi:hypothetical protein
VPTGFTTPVKAIVSHHGDFVCRTQFAADVQHRRQGELHTFTHGISNGVVPPMLLQLRSEEATVVIDHSSEGRASP